MMLSQLLKECHTRGIRFELIDNKVKLKAPEGTLTPDLVSQLKTYKAEILAGLQKETAGYEQPNSDGTPALSYNQRRLWFLEQVEESTSQFNLPMALTLKGELDQSALYHALLTVLDRHPVLRTVYRDNDGEPVPVLLPSEDFVIHELDYSESANGKRLKNQVSIDASRPFDLAVDYMLQVYLYRLSIEEHVILFNIHHIASDGWSLTIFIRELTELYNGYRLNRSNMLPSLSRHYGDFANWQNNWLSGSNLERHLAFWKQQLKGAPPQHNLPLDRSRPVAANNLGDGYLSELPEALGEALEQMAQEQGVTMFMLLQTAFAAVIGRYGQNSDVVMGSPIANRHHKDFETVMGYFVNTLALRTCWEGNPSFARLLADNKRSLIDAFEYQSVPYELLLDELKVERNLSHNALFQILFVLQNNERADDARFEGILASDFPLSHGASQFDFTLSVYQAEGKYILDWHYASELFDHSTISRLSESYELLLAQIVQNIDINLGDIDLVPEKQKQLLFEQARHEDTQDFTSTGISVCDLIERWAVSTPEAVAVQHGRQVMTYDELVSRANQLAGWLRLQHIGKGSLVAISLPRSLDMSVAILAVIKSGAAYLPIDPALPVSRQQYLLEDSQTDMLLCWESTLIPCSGYLLLDLASTKEMLQGQPSEVSPAEISEADFAYVNYTSGTTGKPKGVRISHGNLISYCLAAQHHYQVMPEDRILQTSSFSFDACVEEHFMALVHGAAVVYRDDLVLADWQHFNEFVDQYRITIAGLPTAVWNSLSADISDSSIAVSNSLRLIILGGEALTASRLSHWKKYIGESIQLLNTYGPTETTIIATAYDTKNWLEGTAVPIGQPLGSHRCYILDSERRLVPQGAVGELCIAGPAVSPGYINNAGSTEAFINCEILPGLAERLYCTGDKARLLDSGDIEYWGRVDDQIKIRGFRIEPSEIEAVILQHPGVVQTRVLANDYPGSGKLLFAYIVLEPRLSNKSEQVKQDLWQQIKSELPDYMQPAQLLFIDSIPLTVLGKLDKSKLPEPDFQHTSEKVITAPKNDIEQLMLEIWQSLLKVDRISTDSSFFELGGHSLLGVKLIARIKDQLSVELSIRDLFESPTIQGLALRLERNTSEQEQRWLDFDQEIHLVTTSSPPLHLEDISERLEQLNRHFDNKKIIRVLLTGGTGFVGAFILDELLSHNPGLKVYCLVRAPDAKQGFNRLVENMASYGLWQTDFHHRIVAIPADLCEPDLGLDKGQWDALATGTEWIIHNGAQVNHIMPYSELKQANVDSTQSLLRLASQSKVKLFSYISTTGIFMPTEQPRLITECEPIGDEKHTKDFGYRASKWVAEGLVDHARKQGLPCHIFRLGRVAADSKTGACSQNDVVARYIKSCIDLGGYPQDETNERMIPVNLAAKAIISLSMLLSRKPQNFHLIGRHTLGWNEILSYSPNRLHTYPFDNWIERVESRTKSDNPLPISPYLLILKQVAKSLRSIKKVPETYFDICQDYTETIMAEKGVHFSVLGEAYCKQYLSKLEVDFKQG
ncbi:non-ribosomal peptide synthetase [Photobacterium gaetbulicola]|uniref:Carrier domain-containing protein n=1 Tax=Photobacterium gaetbulicola Gung47 TaxID=658445 RepID=A0A0C5WU84_9GAMM|nr:non-ribosomal peptide synthetase [Photobacterium gaetbulicola]AJR06620.1 hypothetical protein H744_1c1602 [Photobacterium gaetbulicola Gung47]PSU13944.1 non-ribosomal peptide synthetase [Photobacterium gaetbulicola]